MRYLIFLSIFILSCQQTASRHNNDADQDNNSGKLVHMVLFKLKSEADKQTLIESIEKFKNVDVIKKMEVGTYEDTGNPKSTVSDYTVMMRLTFDDLAAFRIYEKHPVHMASIAATKDLMAGPPIGYDYYVK